MSGTAIGFVKIGNLLSLGVGQATAKGLLEYVEDVVIKGENDMDKLIMADVEETNQGSKRAFETQGFTLVDPSTVKVNIDGELQDWTAATPDNCLLFKKSVNVGKRKAASVSGGERKQSHK